MEDYTSEVTAKVLSINGNVFRVNLGKNLYDNHDAIEVEILDPKGIFHFIDPITDKIIKYNTVIIVDKTPSKKIFKSLVVGSIIKAIRYKHPKTGKYNLVLTKLVA